MNKVAVVRDQSKELLKRVAEEPRNTIQVIFGGRQVGKTTLAVQVAENCGLAYHFASADEPTLRSAEWLADQWTEGRRLARASNGRGALLLLDEAHKITHWSERVKRFWDEDTLNKCPLKVVLLGSSPLLIQRGITESLAGRFEKSYLPHWSFPEMRDAFGWTLAKYLFFGGYPGAAKYEHDLARWERFVFDAIIEPSLGRDVLLQSRIDRPELMRRLVEIGCSHSGQVVSLTKLQAGLQKNGNVSTLAHYLDLLAGSSLLCGLQKYSGTVIRQRRSAPKLQVFDTALLSAMSGLSPEEAQSNRSHWGRVVESAVGAHLAKAASAGACKAYYWRDGVFEVDFVASRGERVLAIEVKSGKRAGRLDGMDSFSSRYPGARRLLVRSHSPQDTLDEGLSMQGRKLQVGLEGIALEDFLSKPVEHWLVY